MCDEDQVDDLEDRVSELERLIERQKNAHEEYKKQFVKPRLQDLEASCDDAQAKVAELEDAVAVLKDRVRELEVGIDSVIGLAEDEQGGPAKRAADLRLGLIRAAEAQTDSTTAGKHWRDVREFFAEHGHGKVKKPLCYQAMEDATDHEGFYTREDALTLPSGRTGRGIFVDTEKLPNSTAVEPSNNVTTGIGGTPTHIHAETAVDD